MRRKKLFQKVMGVTVTVILTSSTCISPILADTIAGKPEVQAVFSAGEDAADGENLFTDGSVETGTEVIDSGIEDNEVLSTQENYDIYIKEQPKDVTAQKGDKVIFAVVAEGTGLTYQWQYRTSANSEWKNFSGGTEATLEKVAGSWDGWQVKCVLKDEKGNYLDSDIAKIEFNKPLAIVGQPKDVTVKKGDKVTFTVGAEGTGLTYQWQYRTSANSEWKNFSGGTEATLEKVSGSWDGWQVRCVVKDQEGKSLTSNIARITINKPLAIVGQPKDVTVKKGDKVTFTVGAEGTGLTYQWQYRTSANSEWKNFSGGTEATLEKVSGSWDGWQVRCVVKDKEGKSLTSNTAKITINTKSLVIVEQPKNVTVKKGDKVTFTVGAEGTGLTYQWQYRTSANSEWKNFSGGTEATLQKVTGIWNGWYVRCVIKDSDGNTVNSREALLNIQYENHIVTFVSASTKKIITTAEAQKFTSVAGLPAGDIIYLPKEITAKASKPCSCYIIENGNHIPVNLEAVVEGSSASYEDLELFFYVTSDVTVYVNE